MGARFKIPLLGCILVGAALRGGEEASKDLWISGRILDGEGRGIAAARVIAYPQIGDPFAQQDGMEFVAHAMVAFSRSDSLDEKSPEAVTRADGSYRIDGLEKRYYVIEVLAPGFSPGERAGLLPSRDKVDIPMEKGSIFGGSVLDSASKESIEGARIMAYRHSDSSDLLAAYVLRTLPPLDAATTDAAGRFKLETLGRGTYSFVVSARGYQEGTFLKIKIRRGGDEHRSFALSRGLAISGKVVSPSGEPVDGARVRARKALESGRDEADFRRPDDGTITTDEQGNFTFDTLAPGEYFLLAWHQRYASQELKGVRAGADPLTITLPRGLLISGKVVSPSREPIAGAHVRIRNAGISGLDEMMSLRLDRGTIATDATGNFSFDHLAPGEYLLLTWHPRYAFEERKGVQAGGDPLTIVLSQGVSIHGKVTDAGTGDPIPGARVSLGDFYVFQRYWEDLGKEALTDASGRFEIPGLRTSIPTAHIHAAGFVPRTNLKLQVKENEAMNLNFQLERTATISGRAVDSSGAGVANARVLAVRRVRDLTTKAGEAWTDGDGRFRFPDLEGGDGISLVVFSADHLKGRTDPFSVRAGEVLDLPDILLLLAGSIEGTVMGPGGRPVADVEVLVIPEGQIEPDRTLRATSDVSGKFLLKGLRTGTVDLVARSDDYIEEIMRGVKVRQGEVTLGVKVALRKGSHVKGIVVDSAGKPLAGARILARDISPSGMRELGASSEKDGSFIFDNLLSTDSLEIEVRHSDCVGIAKEEVRVNTEDLKVVLTRLGGVRGMVFDASGKPVTSFKVQLVPKDLGAGGRPGERPKPREYSAATDGLFVYARISPGAYDVQIYAPGSLLFTFPDVQVGSEVKDLGKAVLQESGTMNGTVTDPKGNPIVGARVRVVRGLTKFKAKPSPAGDPSQCLTDARGVFEFRGLKDGPVSLSVTAKGFVMGRVENIDTKMPAARDIKVILEVGSEIFGKVLDASGEAMNGVSVYLKAPAERPDLNQRTTTKSDGEFRFTGLASGKYLVVAQRSGSARGAYPRAEITLEAGESKEIKLVFE